MESKVTGVVDGKVHLIVISTDIGAGKVVAIVILVGYKV